MTPIEKSLLGTMQLGGVITQTIIDKVGEEAFSSPLGRRLYTSMRDDFALRSEVNIITIIQSLRQEEMGDAASIIPLAAPGEIDKLCKSVNDAYVKRERKRIIDSQAASQVVDAGKIQSEFMKLDAYASRGLTREKDLAKRSLERAEEANQMIRQGGSLYPMCGFDPLDQRLFGWEDGLHVVASPPGVGKTSFLLWLKKGFQNREYQTGFISLEMKQNALTYRTAGADLGINPNLLKTLSVSDENIGRYKKWVEGQKGNESILESPVDRTREAVRELMIRMYLAGCKVIMLDYLQLIQDSRAKNAVREATISVSQTSKDIGFPVVSAAQLSRKVENNYRKIPNMTDLAEAAMIEREAKTIMFLWKPSMYGIRMPTEEAYPDNYIRVIFGKIRNNQDLRPLHMLHEQLIWTEIRDPEAH